MNLKNAKGGSQAALFKCQCVVGLCVVGLPAGAVRRLSVTDDEARLAERRFQAGTLVADRITGIPCGRIDYTVEV